MADLPTNFKDDILDTSVNTRRRYRVYENTDGTIELEDVTEYSQVGDEFGAGQINATNMEVNKRFDKNMIVRDLDTINAITKEGYVPDALALKEVNDSLSGETLWEQTITSGMSFGQTNITVNNIDEYSRYEIFSVANSGSAINRIITSGRIPVGYGTVINVGLNFRSVDYSNNVFSFSSATKVTDSSQNNTTVIPCKIIGYK